MTSGTRPRRLLALLETLLTSADAAVWWGSAHAIRLAGTRRIQGKIVALLLTEPMGERQGALMEALSDSNDPRYVWLIRRVLKNKNSRYSSDSRQIAADKLRYLASRNKKDLKLLIHVLRDEDPAVRVSAAIAAFPFLDDPAVRAATNELANDPALALGVPVAETARMLLAGYTDHIVSPNARARQRALLKRR